MSSNADPDVVAEYAALIQSVFVGGCLNYAVLTLLVYEYLITFASEVRLFWNRRVTGASVLFIVNRYIPLVLHFLSAFGDVRRLTQQSCRTSVFVVHAFTVFEYFPWAAFSALRVFALSRRGYKWPLAILVLSISLIPAGLNFAQYAWLETAYDPVAKCYTTIDLTPQLVQLFTILSRASLIAADALVITVTWVSTYKTTGMTRSWGSANSFASTLQRDGTIYFLTLLVLNALHLTFTMVNLSIDVLESLSYLSLFTEPLTAILVSRFLLNLQDVYQSRRAFDGTSPAVSTILGGLNSMRFAAVIGSVGTYLTTEQSSEPDPEYELQGSRALIEGKSTQGDG